MSRAALALLLVCAAALSAGDVTQSPHQGTVVLPERSFANVWVFAETTDGVRHTPDSERGASELSVPRGKYLRVEYARPDEVNWLRADTAMGKEDWANAAALFQASAKTGKTWYTLHSSLLRGAECSLRAGKPDDAAKALDALTAAFPKSVEQSKVAALRAQTLAAKNDIPGALKAYTELAKRADWGVDALALGSLGQAEILAGEKKFAEAAAVLAGAFAKLNPDRNPELFGKLGAELAKAQRAADQTDPAIITLRRLAYGGPDANIRANAQLQWAQLLMAAKDAKSLGLAFDHAAIVMLSRDADPAIVNQGNALARQISSLIDKLLPDQCSDAEKAEYRRYLQR